jgi:hypothetical protein
MKQTTTSFPHTVIFDRASTLEDLKRLPPETKSRLLLARLARIGAMDTYWLDLGNNAASGQYILGQPLNDRNHRKAERLRTVSELYLEISDVKKAEDPLPSCSAMR